LFGKHGPAFMQVTETNAEGLKREFRVVVPRRRARGKGRQPAR